MHIGRLNFGSVLGKFDIGLLLESLELDFRTHPCKRDQHGTNTPPSIRNKISAKMMNKEV